MLSCSLYNVVHSNTMLNILSNNKYIIEQNSIVIQEDKSKKHSILT